MKWVKRNENRNGGGGEDLQTTVQMCRERESGDEEGLGQKEPQTAMRP